MKTFSLALGAALALTATPALAGTVFSDNFDTENGGISQFNYTGFANFNVTGNVDIISSGSYFNCPSAGACVDLDGTPGPGKLTSTGSFAFGAGDTVKLSFDISGNQRGGPADEFDVGFAFGGPTSINGYYFDNGGGPVIVGNYVGITGVTTYTSLNSTDVFKTFSIGFTAVTAGSLGFQFATQSNDNLGPVLDNVNLDVSGGSSVPEPATWAMMIAGFGLAGGALRRRRTTVAFA